MNGRGSRTSEEEPKQAGESTGLVGRDRELTAIAELLASVREGFSAVQVLRGEAGIGKTALLEDAIATAPDFSIVRLVGIQSEMRLSFAALHQLLAPFLDDLDELPGPQVRALRAVFGLSEGDAPDPFLIGLATLTLLSNAATRRALLIVVDDAQWLDQETVDALGFVARRLYADRVGLLIAIRDTNEGHLLFDGLRSFAIDPLTMRASNDLLESTVGRPVASNVRDRILAEANGNPLALVELTRELSADQIAGTATLPEPLAVGGRIEARFLRQVRRLPPETQMFLLVAAAEPTGDPVLVWRAGRQLGFDERAISPAEAEQLVSLGPPIQFRHSLIRSATYHGATDAERRHVHTALANATDAGRDPDRRAWHLAAAAHAPDEEVAAELELASQRAQNRGGYGATAALLARAAELTPDTDRRALRYFAAAVADLTAGNSTSANANLAHALPDLGDDFLAAQARRLQAAILFIDASPDTTGEVGVLGRHQEIIPMMLEAALALRPMDIRQARETLCDALPMAVWFGKSTSASARDVGRAGKSLKLAPEMEPTSVDLVFDGLAEVFGEGFGGAVPMLRDGLAAMRGDPGVRDLPRALALGCWAGFALGDDVGARELAELCVAFSRERGAFQFLPEGLNYLGQSELRVGSLAAAEAYFAEETELQTLMGRGGPSDACQLIVSAWRGREAEVRATAPVQRAAARKAGIGYVVGLIDYSLVVLELGLGNYNAASSIDEPELDADVGMSAFRAADAVEAHARGGDRAVAEATLAWLTARAVANESSLDLGLLARSRALLADDSDAETHYLAALDLLRKSAGMPHVARAHLLYGEWLRRQKRRREARVQLAAALDIFESIGADAFAERARVELLGTGATARRRVEETRNDLTPQEEQIARLAAGGATNAEIAERLFISSSTVDYHLRKVFRKLDIASRRELGESALLNR